jgi:undecaprenyl-diphosphatase
MRRWERIIFSLSSLAVLVTIGLKLHELDMPAARFVRSFDIHELNRIGDFLALPGQGAVVAGVFILIGLFGWGLKRDLLKVLAVRGLVAQLVATAVTQLLKHLIGRPRPRFAHADEFSLGPSLASGLDAFPSGHSVNAFAAATVLSWFVPGLRVPFFLIAGLVGLSRVVRGSHFPTDVLAGAVLGALIGSLAAAGLRRWRDEAFSVLVRTGMPIVASVFLLVWVVLHPMPPWSQEIRHVYGGAALILAGMLMRGLAIVQQGVKQADGGGPLRAGGGLVMVLGVAVACGPWWGGVLLFVALLPNVRAGLIPARGEPVALPGTRCTLQSNGRPTGPWEGDHHPGLTAGWPSPASEGRGGGVVQVWRQEAIAAGAAVMAIMTIRSVKGLIPLG